MQRSATLVVLIAFAPDARKMALQVFERRYPLTEYPSPDGAAWYQGLRS